MIVCGLYVFDSPLLGGKVFVAPPSESQIPDPAVTSNDPDNDRLSIIRRPSGIRFYLSYALARTYL